MNTTKLNDWLQIAAAIGVITGLIMVAYEIRISNRIGIEQANAAALERWDTMLELGTSREVADIFVRALEGDELSRADVFILNSFIDQYLNTTGYQLRLTETGSLDDVEHTAFHGTIQYYLGSEYARRRWTIVRAFYSRRIVESVDAALAAQDQRDVLGYLDYIRGTTDQVE